MTLGFLPARVLLPGLGAGGNLEPDSPALSRRQAMGQWLQRHLCKQLPLALASLLHGEGEIKMMTHFSTSGFPMEPRRFLVCIL